MKNMDICAEQIAYNNLLVIIPWNTKGRNAQKHIALSLM